MPRPRYPSTKRTRTSAVRGLRVFLLFFLRTGMANGKTTTGRGAAPELLRASHAPIGATDPSARTTRPEARLAFISTVKRASQSLASSGSTSTCAISRSRPGSPSKPCVCLVERPSGSSRSRPRASSNPVKSVSARRASMAGLSERRRAVSDSQSRAAASCNTPSTATRTSRRNAARSRVMSGGGRGVSGFASAAASGWSRFSHSSRRLESTPRTSSRRWSSTSSSSSVLAPTGTVCARTFQTCDRWRNSRPSERCRPYSRT